MTLTIIVLDKIFPIVILASILILAVFLLFLYFKKIPALYGILLGIQFVIFGLFLLYVWKLLVIDSQITSTFFNYFFPIGLVFGFSGFLLTIINVFKTTNK